MSPWESSICAVIDQEEIAVANERVQLENLEVGERPALESVTRGLMKIQQTEQIMCMP
jgi:hypothetical protein